MAVTILAPLQDDTVASPVSVSVGYSFSSGTFTLTASVGSHPDPSPPSVSGDGVHTASISVIVTSPTAYTVTAVTDPTSGGSDSQSNVTVTPGPAPVEIEDFEPITPLDKSKKKYKVKGKFKDQRPAITRVVCRIYEVDVTSQTRTEVTWGEDPSPDGSNFTWKVDVEFAMNAGFRYVARAFAYAGEQPVASSSKWINK